MLRLLVRLILGVPACALLLFAVAANRPWFFRHVVFPAYYVAPPEQTLTALRCFALLLALGLLACAVIAGRRATAAGALRIALSLVASVVACDLLLRAVPVRPEARSPHPRLEWLLGVPDARTGWAFLPRREVELTTPGSGRVVRYATDAHGDRAPAPDWIEDAQAPTLIVAGESIATGHGLAWSDTFPARLGTLLSLQVVVVAEGGYSTAQAHLRALDALARLAHPAALVMTVLPVQLKRNLLEDRPRLVERDGQLVLVPGERAQRGLRRLFNEGLPYLNDARLAESLSLTHAILAASAAAARAKGARPLFVVPTFLAAEAQSDPIDEFVRVALAGLPHVVVRLDPARRIPWDGHPDEAGARELAAAIAVALH